MVKVDAIEGTVDDALWYHYDLASDVLYLRLVRHRQAQTYAEETPEGLVLRRADTGEVAGLTVISWWKRFGTGDLPDSLRKLEEYIEPWARRVAA